MSRLTADQESRGDDGTPGAGEIDSLMRVNLAEGCGAVNRAARSGGQSVWFIWSVLSIRSVRSVSCGWLNKTNQTDQTDQIDQTDQTDRIDQIDRARPARELCSWDAFLYKNDCAGH